MRSIMLLLAAISTVFASMPAQAHRGGGGRTTAAILGVVAGAALGTAVSSASRGRGYGGSYGGGYGGSYGYPQSYPVPPVHYQQSYQGYPQAYQPAYQPAYEPAYQPNYQAAYPAQGYVAPVQQAYGDTGYPSSAARRPQAPPNGVRCMVWNGYGYIPQRTC